MRASVLAWSRPTSTSRARPPRSSFRVCAEHVAFDELVALGNAGLVEAAARFDASRGASFATFAWYRVQGSIIDGVRKMTQLPKRTWAKLLALRAASEYLEQRAERDAGATARGTPPTEGADALAQIKTAMSAIRTMYVTSLEAMREDGFDTAGPKYEPAAEIDLGRRGRELRIAIDKLPERERVLMRKHYWEGKNLLEAGEELGISKSWASRLHSQAVERLRQLVEPEETG